MTGWTVDYGDGPRPVELPHAWRQDVPVTWEGPAIYRTETTVLHDDEWLVFHGASYEARILLDGKEALVHQGIWDEFAVSLSRFAGKAVNVEVRVTKNGGESFPVKSVLSGFLPYVFQTFGGLYGGVSIVRSSSDPTVPSPDSRTQLNNERSLRGRVREGAKEKRTVARTSTWSPTCRVSVEGRDLFVDGKPFYLRGVLSWGWYPELGHTNPSDAAIRDEVRKAKAMGFNTIKFCLWVPRHRFFEILEEEGMFAWMELPLWAPARDSDKQAAMAQEIERIVRQIAHHSSIIAWTVGCELGPATSAEFRARLVKTVQDVTGCPLVKDDSGGAEMYGGDLREYGTFQDFHPYCDTHFYPAVLESLRPGVRFSGPVLLGEFNDFDVHRDLRTIAQQQPFWASEDSALNDIGVRWQHDLPNFIKKTRWAHEDPTELKKSSASKGAWVRRKVMESVRACPEIAGFVVTGWRHTPISTAGMVDDDLVPVYPQFSTNKWNDETSFFLVPFRKPPWIAGGNRPGWQDTQCCFEGAVSFCIGVHSTAGLTGSCQWKFGEKSGVCEAVSFGDHGRQVVGRVTIEDVRAGDYLLEVEFAGKKDEWPISVTPTLSRDSFENWRSAAEISETIGITGQHGGNLLTSRLDEKALECARNGGRVVTLLSDPNLTIPMPFWRECAFEITPEFPFGHEAWHKLYGIAPDRALSRELLEEIVGDCSVLMNRVDTRTYQEHPYLITARVGMGKVLVTTMRPQGGHGAQPHGIGNNPSGIAFLRWALVGKW